MRFIVILTLALIVFMQLPSSVSAQVGGSPIFKRVTIYASFGGLIGASTSLLWWLTDPLSPSNNLSQGLIVGFGVGTIFGFGFGVHQAFQKTIPPAENESTAMLNSYPEQNLSQPSYFEQTQIYSRKDYKNERLTLLAIRFDY